MIASPTRLASPSSPPIPPPPLLPNVQFVGPKVAPLYDIVRLPPRSGYRPNQGGRVRAMDAAQVFDPESEASEALEQRAPLKIAIVGFGNFDQFLTRTFAAQGHTIFAHSRSDYSAVAHCLGAEFFRDPNDLCEQQPDVVVLCTSILSAEAVLRSLPLQRLRRSTLFVDVLSVKEFPKNLLLHLLPPDFDILCTHPMFGPESGKYGWAGLPLVYDKVRIGDTGGCADRCCRFIDIFAREGCRMVEMSCTEHDEHAAGSQFLTHTVGRLLAKFDLKSTPINTKGYETLLQLVENTCSDSFNLYNGLFMYNKNSTELLERLDHALDSLKKELSLGCTIFCVSSSLKALAAALNLYLRTTEKKNLSFLGTIQPVVFFCSLHDCILILQRARIGLRMYYVIFLIRKITMSYLGTLDRPWSKEELLCSPKHHMNSY